MIIHLNGWPGVGKYTVGKVLADNIGARFVYNHLLHDVAFACAGRGDEERWPLYEKVRAAAYDVLSRRPHDETFVMTNALCNGVAREEEAWVNVVDLAMSRAEKLIPAILLAKTEIIAQRIEATNRSNMKLKDSEALRVMVSKYTLQVPDVPETLELDVSKLSPSEAVNEIRFHLERVANVSAPATNQHKIMK